MVIILSKKYVMETKEIISARYTPEDILQILIDFYIFQVYFTLDLNPGCDLNFEITIEELEKIYDLQKEPESLIRYLSYLFDIDINKTEFQEIFINKKNTVYILCKFIADNAIKETIVPIVSMGKPCREAAIFKALKNGLEKKGVKTKNMKPSMEFSPFFFKYTIEILETASKLSPGIFSYYKSKPSPILNKLELFSFILSVLILILTIIFNKFSWYILFLFILPMIFSFIANKQMPYKSDISGYKTLRDLVVEMEKRMK